jgi:hypothetical protein
MLRRLLGAGLLLGVLLALPAGDLLAQNKKKADPKKDAPPADSDKLAAGDFAGALKSVPGTDRLFTLEVQQVTLVPTGARVTVQPTGNAGRVLRIQNQMVSAQRQALRARTVQQRVQAANRLARLQGQLQRVVAQLQAAGARAPAGYRYQTKKQDIEFQLRDDVKVRSMFLLDQFDEKGNPKKLTKEEKDAARGKDKNLPGYEASLERLEVGQKVRLSMGSAPTKKPAAKEKNKDVDMDDKDGEKKMQVKLVVILAEANKDAPAPKGKKK